MDFTGQHVVVTGASSGIGLATAVRIVKLGGTVTMIARRAGVLKAEAARIGAAARWIAADVGDKAAILAAMDEAIARSGPIDGLFLNAGIGGMFAPAADYTDEAFEAVMRVNTTSLF